jgi:hypothetical protein
VALPVALCSAATIAARRQRSNQTQPGEHPEGEHHYNPGNQSGKAARIVPKEKANESDEPHHDRS